MFNNCQKLGTVDLSLFNTINVTNTQSMFNKCSALYQIYVGDDWSMANCTSSTKMFYNCNNIPGWSSGSVDASKAHTDSGGYLTLKTA